MNGVRKALSSPTRGGEQVTSIVLNPTLCHAKQARCYRQLVPTDFKAKKPEPTEECTCK